MLAYLTKRINLILLALIFLVALFLRLYKISDFECLNWDEAAFGYNAYSILQTGRDEYGVKYPLQFKSFGDYKGPLYIYMLVPVIKTFGLSVFSVRLLPAIFGSLSVLVFYFIVKLIFSDKNISLLSSFFLAISPWHLQFTKAGFEAGISSFFILTGVLGFLIGIKGKKIGYIISTLSFAASTYTYFADRFFAPVMVCLLIYIFRKKLIKNYKILIVSAILGLLLIIPILPSLFSSGHEEKILKTTIFGYRRSFEYVQRIKKEDKILIFYYLFHTDIFEKGWGIMNNYLNHFSPKDLFLEGVVSDPRQFIWKMGLMYYYDILLVGIGLYFLIKSKFKNKWLVLGWLLISPLPSIITRDTVSARRSLNMVYPLLILSALGLIWIIEWVKKYKTVVRLLLYFSGISLFIYCFVFYLISFYMFTPNHAYKGPAGWQCGYSELVSYMQEMKNDADNIIVDTTYQGPYIFFLFFEKYNPASYQKQVKFAQDSPDTLGEGIGYDRYIFKPIYWPEDRCYAGRIYAGPPDRLPYKDLKPMDVKILNNIYFKNGETAWTIIKTLKEPTPSCKLKEI